MFSSERTMTKIIYFLLFLCSLDSILTKILHEQTKIDDRLEIVFVHGDDEARMNHIKASQYCRNLTTTLKINSTVAEPRISDLLSIHEGYQLKEKIMPFVLKHTSEVFWIGCFASWYQTHHGLRLRMKWTDHSIVTFKNFHHGIKVPHFLHSDNHMCGMVAYNNGKWDLENCRTKQFFVCEIVNFKIAPEYPENETRLKDPPAFLHRV